MTELIMFQRLYCIARKIRYKAYKTKRSVKHLLIVCLILAVAGLCFSFLSTSNTFVENIEKVKQTVSEAFTKPHTDFQSASVVRVVDGDTIIVNINGTEQTVRMIGIDTPESVASDEYLEKTGKENTVEGKAASEITEELLQGKTIYLQKDISETDRYDRLLRYVWLERPADETNIGEVTAKMVNAILIAKGTAIPVVYEPDSKYANVFQSIYEGRR